MRTEDQHKILLVEDDLDIAEELVCTLEALGHKSTHVETRDAAESAFDSDNYCLILMDLQIKASAKTLAPKIEAGRTLLERLRERLPERLPDATHRTPIVVLSAHTQTQEAVRLMQRGATDVLEKPLSKNNPSFDLRIAKALQDCGRKSHASCGAPILRPDETGLTIDVARRTVRYLGIEIPTSKSNAVKGRHLQKQAFGVLVALASRNGERLSATYIDDFLFKHGLLGDRMGSNLSAIRTRIVSAFQDALKAANQPVEEIGRLIAVEKDCMRLRAVGPVQLLSFAEEGTRL